MSVQSFTFGESRPFQALDFWQFWECQYNGHYYELPFSVRAHGKYYYSLLYVRSALQAKANIIVKNHIPTPLMPRQLLFKWVLDYLWFGNGYLEKRLSKTGKLLGLSHSPAKYTRRMKDNGYLFLSETEEGLHYHEFASGSVFHLIAPDVNQEIYGVPEWLPAIQSALLNESATQFRLRYYQNGSHAGYIMYLTDANITEDDIDLLQEQLRQSKGPGNFRNLLLYAPNGKSDGVKLLPISEVSAKDEFFNIKAVSRDDQLAACRVPPNLIGIVPQNSSGFGSIKDAAYIFDLHEVQPIQQTLLGVNEWLGVEALKFQARVEMAQSALGIEGGGEISRR